MRQVPSNRSLIVRLLLLLRSNGNCTRAHYRGGAVSCQTRRNRFRNPVCERLAGLDAELSDDRAPALDVALVALLEFLRGRVHHFHGIAGISLARHLAAGGL